MRWILITLFLYIANWSYSQTQFVDNDSNYISKSLILKLKPQFSVLQNPRGINSAELNFYLDKLGVYSLERIYPHHQPILEPINSIGDSLVDLSLFYRLNYFGEFNIKILISKLLTTNLFEYVEQEAKNNLMFTPNDPHLANQYFPQKVKAFEAWDIETGDTNIVIGIVDTGTDLLGEDLKDGIKLNFADPIDGIDNDNDGFIDNFFGWDMAMNDNNPSSFGVHHGCFVSGISSARVNNNIGIAGLGFNTKYLPIKINNNEGIITKGYEGIVYAADHGAAIINNSWGGNVKNRYGQDIVNYATFNQNALVIGAGGNSNNDLWIFPASFENALSIAATDSLDQKWSNSSFGSQIDLSAPGEAVYSTWTANGYFASSGTSFSAPGVAGAAAILKSNRPHLSALQLGEQLRVTSDLIDTIMANQNYIEQLGSGRLNMLRSLVDSLKPSIRFRDRIVESNHFSPADTIKFKGKFVNLLAPSSSSLAVTVSSTSPYLTVINPHFTLGQLATWGSIDKYNFPFFLKIAPTTPAGTIAEIKFSYSDTNYSGFEYFRFALNPNFVNLEQNNLKTSFANNSIIGYANYTKSYGLGMYYKNSLNLLSWAGLVVGNSSGKVSSNIYGETGYDADFQNTQNLTSYFDPNLNTTVYKTTYNDDGANFTKLFLSIDQSFYTITSNDDIIFVKYLIKNEGLTPLNTLYIGLFADYDIGISSNNRAEADTTLKLAYTYPTSGGVHTGIMLLDSFPLIINQIDNDGSQNSININDGFLDYEKYNALTNKRTNAGFGSNSGSDVSTMISTGPHILAAGDSLEINFALIGADHLYGLKQAAQKAHDLFYNIASLTEPGGIHWAEVFPNPFNKTLHIKFNSMIDSPIKLEIYDLTGRLAKEAHLKTNTYQTQIDVSQLSEGQYFYKLIFDNHIESGIIIKP